MDGSKNLSINGKQLKKVDKNTFVFENEEEKENIKIEGNYLAGVRLNIKNEKIEIVPRLKWYETALTIMIFAFVCVWGNIPALCQIFPIVGGAVGGLISGAFTLLNIFLMRSAKKVWLKLLIWLGIFVLTVVTCFGVAKLILFI